ncbi:AGAP001453-PA-like protein [Anopheles sinensis]|uniref:AGAP001453-PA-like protein n=1 Tax=Anopheles sinensis TaxID=74873 RepID=A0A084VS57_ANOSI|nr:AGAP001453-PA-like protein [Anopheles sinensis]
MNKRESDKLLRLLTKIAKGYGIDDSEEKATGSRNSTESRKRKKTTEQKEAGGKRSRPVEWVNPLLKPLVQSLTSNPNITHQQFHLHHTVLQVPLQPNVLRNDTLFSHFEIKTPWTVRLPVPLYCTPGPGPTPPDPMVRQVLAKYNYKRELASVHRAYKLIETHRSLPNLDLREVEEDDTVKNSAAVIYAGLLDREPDRYLLLESGYDYHFTGGSMASIVTPKGSRTLATVFAAGGENLEEVNIIQLDHLDSQESNKIEAKKSANCLTEDLDGPVLEITADVAGRCVLIRKRHTIVVLREVPSRRSRQENDEEPSTISSGDTEWRATQRIHSNVPFASVCIMNLSLLVKRTISICTTDYRRHMRLWQIDRKADPVEKCSKKLPRNKSRIEMQTEEIPKEDKWSAVRCVDGRSLIACLNRHQIHLYSIREETDRNDSDEEVESPKVKFVFRGSSDVSQWTIACERASALEVAPSERLIFIATCHKIIVANVESLECDEASSSSSSSSNDESMLRVNVLIVFAHNLRQRPVFMSHVAHSGDDDESDEEGGEHHFLLFGSHLPMSYGVCSFTKSCIKGSASEQPQYYTRHLPLHPSTFHDAYRIAQASGHCLSADEPLKRRFYACQSGMVLLPAKGNGSEQEDGYPHIILQTSGGDLLHQKIVTKRLEQDSSSASDLTQSREEHSNVTEELHRWHEKLLLDYSIKPKPYKATDFRTLKRFRDVFNCTYDPDDLKDFLFHPPAKKRPKRRPKKRMGRESSPTRSISSVSDTSLSASVAGDYAAARPEVSNGRRQRPEPLAWRQTIEELQQYKDVLAPGMLAVWGYGGPDFAMSVGTTTGAQSFTEQIPTKLPPYQNVNEFVGNWVAKTLPVEQLGLDTAEGHINEIQDEIPYDEFGLQPWQEPKTNKVEEEDKLPNQFQRLRELAISQNGMAPLSRAGCEVQTVPKPPTSTRPAKKKYVKGF